MPKHKKSDLEKIAKYERKIAKIKSKEKTLDAEPKADNKAQTTDLEPVDPEADGMEVDQPPETELPEEDCETSLNPASPGANSGVAHDSNDELDSDFLSALGESNSGSKKYGEAIHKEIFNSINKILLDGLQKQQKEKLTEVLLIPNNCKLLDAPKLNIELLSILNNPSRTRDKLLEDRQQEMGIAIGTICQITNSLSRKDFDKFEIIKKLTDVSRILSNLHYQYTEIRRRLINPFLDKNLVESLKENKREEFLYSNLDSSVKSYSAMKRAANAIKPKPVTNSQSKPAKNFQQPPRRTNLNQGQRGALRGAITHQRYKAFKPQDSRPMGPSTRGRAKYP